MVFSQKTGQVKSSASHVTESQASSSQAVDTHASNSQALDQSSNNKDDQIVKKAQQLKQIRDLAESAVKLGQRVEGFRGNREDKQYLALREDLTKNLLQLDKVDACGNEEVRHHRKIAVKKTQSFLEKLEQQKMVCLRQEGSKLSYAGCSVVSLLNYYLTFACMQLVHIND